MATLPAPGYALDPETGVPTAELLPPELRLLTPFMNVSGAFALILLAALLTYHPGDPGFSYTGDAGRVSNAVGDLIEVELLLESKNDYEYVVFEDMKAAGFEPVEVRSGYTGNEMGAYVEFRDQKVAFFVRRLARGKHSVSYRLRAEVPGKFSALPARAYAMYAPEIKANSDEIKLLIIDN